MPNWCINMVKITGPDKERVEFLAACLCGNPWGIRQVCYERLEQHVDTINMEVHIGWVPPTPEACEWIAQNFPALTLEIEYWDGVLYEDELPSFWGSIHIACGEVSWEAKSEKAIVTPRGSSFELP